MANNIRFWLRWSWRDLRARWLQVVAIAMIIALGTGVFAGLGGQETWRVESLDASYDRLHMYDLQMALADGSYVAESDLSTALAGIEGVANWEGRLISPTLVDASQSDRSILVEGRLVGVDVSAGGPHINSLHISDDQGRVLTAADAGKNVAVVEYQFARFHRLEPGDPLRISGGVALDFVGAGQSPEYFTIIPENGIFMGEENYAILFMPLQTVQQITERDGLVNNVVVVLADGADRDAVQAEIERRMAASFPAIGLTMSTRDDDAVAVMLYTDAHEDQVTWDLVAFLFLAGAALAAFNLAGRIVEAQRRQIGIGMALGLPRFWIAFRPLLVGLQIALLGTVLGLLVGLGLNQLFASLFQDLLPLPYWKIDFYLPGYARAVLLGILLPFLATAVPVYRAVRVQPVDAIRSGYLVAKGGGLSALANHLPLPGRSFAQMPFKNLLRSPWRSLLTVLGIAMAIILLTAFVGFRDTFVATMERAKDAYLYEGGERLVVTLDFFYPADNGEIDAVRGLTGPDGAPLLGDVESGLMIGSHFLAPGHEELDVLLELHDMEHAIWRPDVLEGRLAHEPGEIVISEKAADDLGVGVGDSITVEHPRREGVLNFGFVQTEMQITGIHNNPIRALAYLDLSSAGMMGLEGTTNLLVVNPAAGVHTDDVKRALIDQPGVASVQAVKEFAEAFERGLGLFVQVLRIIQGIVLFMAFLIAFNSTSINVDERVREIATMFAFGLPLRTVTRMQVIENLLIGILGTILGVMAGWYVLNQFLAARVEEQLAEFKFLVTISPETLGISLLLGVLVVALTPLLSIRRMKKMDIPSTLRVME